MDRSRQIRGLIIKRLLSSLDQIYDQSWDCAGNIPTLEPEASIFDML